jgi:hypothetical protein
MALKPPSPALAGEVDKATATIDRAVAAINDVGVPAEEVDPSSGEMIGNFPSVQPHRAHQRRLGHHPGSAAQRQARPGPGGRLSPGTWRRGLLAERFESAFDGMVLETPKVRVCPSGGP